MPGFWSRSQKAAPVYLADDDANPVGSVSTPLQSTTMSAALPAATDRSGTTSATAGTAVTAIPANSARRGGLIQNISTGTIGINENGGTAVIGQPGTYTLPANASMALRTNRAVSIVGSAASLPYTASEF